MCIPYKLPVMHTCTHDHYYGNMYTTLIIHVAIYYHIVLIIILKGKLPNKSITMTTLLPW